MIVFFFNDTATTEIYTLSLHDALPICCRFIVRHSRSSRRRVRLVPGLEFDTDHPPALESSSVSFAPQIAIPPLADRKSTRLNSSHANISYAVFCLKKKNNS